MNGLPSPRQEQTICVVTTCECALDGGLQAWLRTTMVELCISDFRSLRVYRKPIIIQDAPIMWRDACHAVIIMPSPPVTNRQCSMPYAVAYPRLCCISSSVCSVLTTNHEAHILSLRTHVLQALLLPLWTSHVHTAYR